ncbi:potassium channel family protein [Streptomyces bambusae]|uniref:Two pore domain potassium channel family protein n=1 Tax=Streptomyces bambusae TaxID=1550616 RepID=A0ABS6Z360_9ACTN|nr:potassium channel family protein [Streptomyces bambusae]MBW5482198.1 two pore domain potassium channel family protein [Streptomyces bambusae]
MDATGSGHGSAPPGEAPAGGTPAGASGRRRPTRAAVVVTLRSTTTATVLVAAYYLLPFTRHHVDVTTLVLGLSAVAVIFALQIQSITRSAHPRLRAVEALATTMPLFLLLYSTTYYVLEESVPGSFTEPLSRTDALYFTLTVFSTVGFGDIAARTEPARLVTMTQMAGNILVLGVATRILFGAVEAAVRRQSAGTREAPHRGPSAP